VPDINVKQWQHKAGACAPAGKGWALAYAPVDEMGQNLQVKKVPQQSKNSGAATDVKLDVRVKFIYHISIC
jgi:hypothetical protein